jgi:hypothetical protein
LASLGLVLNAVVLWITHYLDTAVAALRADGHGIKDEGVVRLSLLRTGASTPWAATCSTSPPAAPARR